MVSNLTQKFSKYEDRYEHLIRSGTTDIGTMNCFGSLPIYIPLWCLDSIALP